MNKTELISNHLKLFLQHFNSSPTLEQLTLNKAAITLWEESDLNEPSETSPLVRIFTNNEPYTNLERIVMNNAKSIPEQIPEIIYEEIEHAIASIGFKIRIFAQEFKELITTNYPNKIFWTQRGEIDKQRTILHFLDVFGGEVEQRWMMACRYCLEGEMERLWTEPSDVIERWQNGCELRNSWQLFDYWRTYVAGEVFTGDFAEMVRNLSVWNESSNVEYFWRKIQDGTSSPDRWWTFFQEAYRGRSQDLWIFFLSRSTEEQFRELVRTRLFELFWNLVLSTRFLREFWLVERFLGFMSDEMKNILYVELLERRAENLYFFKKILLALWGCRRGKLRKCCVLFGGLSDVIDELWSGDLCFKYGVFENFSLCDKMVLFHARKRDSFGKVWSRRWSI